MNINYTLEDLPQVAAQLLQNTPHKNLLFYGEMGAGKTTLIKEICKQLQIEGVASSPTFSLVNEYITHTQETVFHFDFYRITDENEAYDIGFEEYVQQNAWCLIEWPQHIKNLLPLDSVAIHLSIVANGQRNLQLK